MTSAIRIVQLSDTHFLEDDIEAEGGEGAYDTDAAFDAVIGHLGDHHDLDLVVVTGDIADNGRPDEYRKAAEAFSRFSVPVNVCPGNHDHLGTYTARMARPRVSTSRVVEIEPWAFVFVESSAATMVEHDSGMTVDPPGHVRLHSNGGLGSREAAWVRRTLDAIDAEHVFVWLHHPPAPPVAMAHDDDYAREWEDLLADNPRVRGMGAGHTHIPDEYVFAGRPVMVAPSLKNNFSLEDRTWLPPGYRSYDFHPDGSVTSEVHLVDDERWPRRRFGRLIHSYFMGEVSFEQMAEIIARRRDG